MKKLDGLGAVFGAGALEVCRTLMRAGHPAEFVGGAVRDLIHARLQDPRAHPRPHDVDIATRATPEEVRRVFRAAGWRSYAQGRGEKHGTIGVISPEGITYEVTTYRRDVETDGRHARVLFARTLEEDLERRDYTANAIACRPELEGESGLLVDPFDGVEDIRQGRLRAVGEASERFREDRLRPIRGYRFAARFGWDIEERTREAMRGSVPYTAGHVSVERFWEELLKMAESILVPGRFERALRQMQEDGMLAVFLPEVAQAEGVRQGEKYHAYDVLTHLLRAADEAGFYHPETAERLTEAELREQSEEQRALQARFRVAALLHDIGKPPTRVVDAEGRTTFHGHEEVGAEMADALLVRLRTSREEREWIVELVRYHMRLLPLAEHGIRRRALHHLAAELKRLSVRQLLAFRLVDKEASGRESSRVPRERVLEAREMIERMEAENAALKVTDLALRGEKIRELLSLQDPKRMWEIGAVQRLLLERVLDEPEQNTEEGLVALLPEVHRQALEQGPRQPMRKGATR